MSWMLDHLHAMLAVLVAIHALEIVSSLITSFWYPSKSGIHPAEWMCIIWWISIVMLVVVSCWYSLLLMVWEVKLTPFVLMSGPHSSSFDDDGDFYLPRACCPNVCIPVNWWWTSCFVVATASCIVHDRSLTTVVRADSDRLSSSKSLFITVSNGDAIN